MGGSVEEQHAEHKVEDDQKNQDAVHHQVHSDIGFVLPVKFFQTFEHPFSFTAKLTFFVFAASVRHPQFLFLIWRPHATHEF